MGFLKSKPTPITKPTVKPATPVKTAEEIVQEREEKVSRAVVAANAGANVRQSLGDVSQAEVTKRNLLGL